MATYQCELFGHFFYSQEMSYTDLLERETTVLESLDQSLRELGAAHIEFAPTGDSLRVQCLFASPNEDLFHVICDATLPLLGNGMEGRYLFVDKDLKTLVFYCLAGAQWKEARIDLPPAGAGIREAQADPPLDASFA